MSRYISTVISKQTGVVHRLSIVAPDPEKARELYHQIATTLEPNGYLADSTYFGREEEL